MPLPLNMLRDRSQELNVPLAAVQWMLFSNAEGPSVRITSKQYRDFAGER
jgi:hypothetical protein